LVGAAVATKEFHKYRSRVRRLKNIALLVLISFLSSCATSPIIPPQPYSVLTARNPSQHQVVDDFLRQDMINKVGGSWHTESESPEWITTEYMQEDAVKPQGFSLKTIVKVPKGKEVSLDSDLNSMDVSKAKVLAFWIKADKSLRKALILELANQSGEKISVELLPYLHSKNKWQEIALGESVLSGLRLENLKSFRLIVNAKEKSVSGEFYLDHLVFSGEENLNLHSLADNLRGFPTTMIEEKRQKELIAAYDERLLQNIAKDTWGYFRDLTDSKTHLPVDHIKNDLKPHIGDYTSPTNIGLYFLACIAAYDFKWLSAREAAERINATLGTLEKLPRWEGLFFNYYNTTNLQVTNRFVSSVDNAWLAAALVVVRQTFPELEEKATTILNSMSFGKLFSEEVGQFFVGYDAEKGSFRNNHYGLLSSETRILSYMAIGKGDVEESHWFRLYRTLPAEWDWQKQVPQGKELSILGHTVFEGYYMYRDIPIVPSWGGALFEFLMPTLLIDELRVAPKGLGANGRNAIRAHIHYAIQEKEYPVWGLSPCAVRRGPRGGYEEFGVPDIGSKGYKDGGVVAPHVTFLALPFESAEAIKNIRAFLSRFPIYGPYGFYDSVDVKKGEVTYQYLALDQGMILIALDNYLNSNAISSRFHADKIASKMEPLLGAEEFYPGFNSET